MKCVYAKVRKAPQGGEYYTIIITLALVNGSNRDEYKRFVLSNIQVFIFRSLL